ncbi:MAG: pseudoazurin [Pseudomonadota bacterium]
MSIKMNRRTVLATSAAFGALSAAGVNADGHTAHVVEMLNKHPDDPRQRMVYVPRVIKVKPGDTVLFKSVDRGHNSASLKGMIPAGAEDWDSKINDDFEMTFTTPGVYGYQCTPHSSTGMVGLVVVEGEGMLDNLEEAKGARLRGRAKKVFEDIWAEAEEGGYLEPTTA